MIRLDECLTKETPIIVTTGKIPKKGLFSRKAKPRKYFLKKFNPAEFVGEEICLIKDIRVSHYFLACLGSFNLDTPMWYQDVKDKFPFIQIASVNFEKPGYQYKSVVDYGFSQNDDNLFEEMLSVAKDKENEKQLCMDMLNMLALDLYMGQTDRFAFNYMFEEDKDHNVRLAPLYDFEHSINPQSMNPGDICFGDLYQFKSIEDCKKFIEKYPKFRDILSSYLDVDLAGIVKMAYAKRRLIVPEKELEMYREFDKGRKELIKEIIRTK